MPHRRLRVAYIDHVARLSGGELALLRTLPALLCEVDPVVVLAEDGPLVEALKDIGVPCKVLRLDESVRDARRSTVARGGLKLTQVIAVLKYSRRLAAELKALEVDLVHTNSLKSALYGGLAGRLARVPVVWHIRDRIADDYLPKPAVRLVRAASHLLPTAVIANSQATLATLPHRRRWVVLASPVVRDATAVDPAVHDLKTGDLTIGLVGRLSPWKGQDVFLRAFATAFPDGEHQARLIGSAMFGEEEWELELRALCTELGLDDRVTFRGFRRDMAAEYHDLDVVVHASTVPEPFGQVVIEAMAGGVPVIASAEGGPSEVVTDGVDGLLVEPRRVDLLAAALRRLAADDRLRAALAVAGTITAQKYTPARTAEGALAVYRSVLVSRKPARPRQRPGGTGS